VFAQDTSLGYFKRESIEEVFVIMSGTGRMTVNDETFPVKQYDGERK
jgi:mannose-6-phosphate isomerase-like protein (cupin superfamily)